MLHGYVIYAIPHSSPFYRIVKLLIHVIEGIGGSANSEVSVDDKLASFHGRLKLLITGVFDKQFELKASDYNVDCGFDDSVSPDFKVV